jgi:hypothetical protein
MLLQLVRNVKVPQGLTNKAGRHEYLWASGCIASYLLDRSGRRGEEKNLPDTGTQTPILGRPVRGLFSLFSFFSSLK